VAGSGAGEPWARSRRISSGRSTRWQGLARALARLPGEPWARFRRSSSGRQAGRQWLRLDYCGGLCVVMANSVAVGAAHLSAAVRPADVAATIAMCASISVASRSLVVHRSRGGAAAFPRRGLATFAVSVWKPSLAFPIALPIASSIAFSRCHNARDTLHGPNLPIAFC